MSKILVVDDEQSIRLLLKLSLTHKGYEVILAEDGETGVKAFEQERPPIVITDIKMPGMDGIEVLKQTKKLDPDAQIIVITGHGDMESAIQALQLEASDFINKPISDEALSVALKRAEEVLWLKQKLRKYTDNLELMVKEATEELRTAHDFQQNLIQSSIDGIVAGDKAGTVIVFNKGAEDLLGYTADEVIGKMQMDAIYPPGESAFVNENLLGQDYGGEGRLINYETRVMTKSATQIPVRMSGVTLIENGFSRGAVYFLQDLREIKRLQTELMENERMSGIGQAVAGMAHYIKNILNGLHGGVYMVNTSLKKNKPALLPKGWAMVENNIGKISDLVMNMLAYSKEREPDRVSCNPNDVAQEVYDLMYETLRARSAISHDRMKEKIIDSRVKLDKDFDFSIDECQLDPTGLHRCLLNLVSNAIDACAVAADEGKDCTVVMRTRNEDHGVRFDIVDNGIGMTKEVQDKIFERFFSTKAGKGTGLGLLVTRKIVDEHGGSISFESEPAKGTTFTMCFPCGGSEEA